MREGVCTELHRRKALNIYCPSMLISLRPVKETISCSSPSSFRQRKRRFSLLVVHWCNTSADLCQVGGTEGYLVQKMSLSSGLLSFKVAA